MLKLSKKAAMFGLDCRALRKQFGELFLVSRQSEDSKGSSGSCGYTKRAAMFGLDARIALAIFGALSVISGAALYSAIENTNITAFHYNAKEIIKATEALYIDTGSLEYYNNSYPNCFNASHLITNNGVTGWNGPYYEGTVIDDGSTLCNMFTDTYNNGIRARIRRLEAADWADVADFGGNDNCDSANPCSMYLQISGDLSSIINVEELDSKFDDSNPNTGNIRYTSVKNYLYVRGFNY